MDVTVAVATFGADSWVDLAHRRALPSAETLGLRAVHIHAPTLHEARNAAVALVDSEWVIHLDADDELEPGYVEAMAAAAADVRAPAVRYVHLGRPASAGMPRVAGHSHACQAACLPDGNWLVVGSAVRTEMVRAVGGWWPEPVYEDWSLWLRCYLAGASFEAVPAAVYRAHVRRDSRNRSLPMAERNRVHHDIVRSVLGERARV